MNALFWTFPLLMFASVVIGWAAELTAVHLSAGMALAILAWLQTSPEFAVEATIAWNQEVHLALANLTGSLRLLLGFGWPIVYFIYWLGKRKRGVKASTMTLPEAFSVEAAILVVPVVYFMVIYFKGTWNAIDGLILSSFYVLYFWLLNRERQFSKSINEKEVSASDETGEPWLVKKILHQSQPIQIICTLAMFIFGGVALWITTHPFVEALKSTAASIGISDFIFVQWIAPIASEFPEKVTAFNWARKPTRAPLAIVNMLSSVTSQWTLLAGLVPILFSISARHMVSIEFTPFQKTEVLLTVVETAVALIILADLKIKSWEMMAFFALWIAQFFMPSTRAYLVPVYGLWFLGEAISLLLNPSRFIAWKRVKRVLLFR